MVKLLLGIWGLTTLTKSENRKSIRKPKTFVEIHKLGVGSHHKEMG